MNWPTLNDIAESAICWCKYCLSFGKRNWSLEDYPIRIRANPVLDLDIGERFKAEPYLAQVIGWWTLSGGGDSPRAAMEELQKSFNEMKAQRMEQGSQMPRPGVSVPIEFASQERVNQDLQLQEEFIRMVLDLEWALITDGSSLWDFHSEDSNDALVQKIRDIYGVDVGDLETGNIAEILERIAASRRAQDT
jgi:hypothetical protein